MRKIEHFFILGATLTTICVTGAYIYKQFNITNDKITHSFPESKFGDFLAAQHAIYVNDFDNAARFTTNLKDTDVSVVQNTVFLSDFLNARMPIDIKLLKNEKSMPAHLMYDAYLIKNNEWKTLHNRHKNDEFALGAPLRIWSAIANNWRTNTLKFIEKLPTNPSWKNFVRGQIYAELGDFEQAAKNFANVDITFINLNDYLYMMSFYNHANMADKAEVLKKQFTSLPGGMFMKDDNKIPDWSLYKGYANQLAFSLIQTISHTKAMMYSDLSVLLLRFAQITSPQLAATNDTTTYYSGLFFYNNKGNYRDTFLKIKPESPFYPFAMFKIADKDNDIEILEKLLDKYPLFVPAITKTVALHTKNGNKRAALRIINRALKNHDLDESGRAFLLKNRANLYYIFDDIKKAQKDLHIAAETLIMDPDVILLQAKIWAAQDRELDNAYDYAMSLVTKNPSDILAWDALGRVVTVREGSLATLDLLERVGEVSETCSSLFEQLGDIYTTNKEIDRAIQAYKRAIDLSDDGLVIIPKIERKLRNLK